MAKKNEELNENCGTRCPKCGADPGCGKHFSHYGQSDHFCVNCAHVWPSK